MSVAVHARELQAHREVVFFCTNWMPKPSVSESKVVHAFGCCCSRGSRRDHGGARVSSSAEPRTPTQRKGLIALPMARGRGGVDGDVEAMSRTGRGGVDGDGCRRWDECPGRCGSGRAIRCALQQKRRELTLRSPGPCRVGLGLWLVGLGLSRVSAGASKNREGSLKLLPSVGPPGSAEEIR